MGNIFNKLHYIGVVLVAFSALLLGGCAHKPTIKPVVKKTIAQRQSQYYQDLRDHGVKVIKLGKTVKLVFPSDFMFAPNSANLFSSYHVVLNTAAKLIRTYDVVTVKVVAFTDNNFMVGPKSRRKALTTRQAQVVSKYLWSCGIKSRIIYAQGYGKQKAIAMNKTPQGQAMNRRLTVSFRFYPAYVPYT